MARILLALLGLAFLALGAWCGWQWWSAVLPFLQALLVIVLIIAGALLLIIGISEVAGAARKAD